VNTLWGIHREGAKSAKDFVLGFNVGLLLEKMSHDIDGDGRNEVVLARDFKLQILDGKTGKTKRWVWMPPAQTKDRPYEMNNGDSLAFFNLSGKAGRRDILIKDRYAISGPSTAISNCCGTGKQTPGTTRFRLMLTGMVWTKCWSAYGFTPRTGLLPARGCTRRSQSALQRVELSRQCFTAPLVELITLLHCSHAAIQTGGDIFSKIVGAEALSF